MFFLIVFILSLSLTLLIRKVAIKKAIMDIPNQRSMHTMPTPRGGGFAVVISWYVGIIYLYSTGEIDAKLFYAFLSGVFLVVIGFWDDIKSLSPKFKIVFQIISTGSALYFLGGMKRIDLGFLVLNNIYILTFFAFGGMLWCINIFNFLDGIDGYVGTEVVFICFSLFVLFLDEVALVLLVATLGFLILNWPKAKIFMGDVGSTLMGFNIAVLAIYYQNTEVTSIFNILILSAVFWADATITLIRRWRNKENLMQAHKKHAYQRIVQYGFSHQKTVLYLLLFNSFGLGLVLLSSIFPELVILFLAIFITILFKVVKFIDKKWSFYS
jgi:Fuc2NAc and GlcNAc transferase